MPTVASSRDGGREALSSIGRYQPIKRLAVGGMAEIYLARLPGVGIEGFEKLVVLKRILPQHALDPELLRMFLDEARLSATLTHPHVTEVYDVGADGEAPFFAMEYVHGANLREILRAHAKTGSAAETAGAQPVPLPLQHAIGIVAAAASGLHYAHERLGPGGEPLGIVHRDVSPSNVLVSFDGAVKVSDFGIAKWSHQRTRTQEGILKGKFAYMSPEQCRGRPVDRRSDVFALGAILYELTTGQSAFDAPSDLEILNRIAAGAAPPPSWPAQLGPYPPGLTAIVMRALAPDPSERYPTMQALQVALESFAREAGLAVSSVALAAFVQSLFPDELAAWRKAQIEGKSLGEHLASDRPARRPAAARDERTATDAHAPPRPRPRTPERRPRLALAIGVLAISAIGGGLAISRLGGSAPAPATVVSEPAHAPAPALEPVPMVRALPATTEQGEERPRPPAVVERRTRRSAKPPATPAPTNVRPSADSRLGTWDPDSPVPP